MANTELLTRIALKYDSYENWTGAGKDLVLLKGEIGICEIPSTNIDSNVAPTVLFKVGDGETTFEKLPWASAKAADVYSWAKASNVILDVEAGQLKFVSGTEGNYTTIHSIELPYVTTETFNALKDSLGLDDNTEDGIIAGINNRLSLIEGTDDKPGLIAQAEARINEKLGEGFDSENTVAVAIQGAENHADTIVADLSKTGGAIYTIDAKVNALADKVALNDGETVKGVITAEIDKLDSTLAGAVTNSVQNANTIVRTVSQTNGKVTVTYAELAEADIPEIHSNKVIVADANGEVAKQTLDAKLTAIDGEINGIKDAIAGGVHFIGTVAAAEDLVDNAITLSDNSSYTAELGDVVIKETQEYIWNGSKWEPLGDITRLGALETKVSNLNVVAPTDLTNKFVSKVTQSEGQVSVEYAQPSAENIKYGTENTVKDKLDEQAGLIDSVSDRANALETKVNLDENETVKGIIESSINDLVHSGAKGSADFVTSVTQEAGKVTVQYGSFPEATDSQAGIVKLGADGGAATHAGLTAVSDRVVDIEDAYVRVDVDNSKLVMGKEGSNMIIFNCGSSTTVI